MSLWGHFLSLILVMPIPVNGVCVSGHHPATIRPTAPRVSRSTRVLARLFLASKPHTSCLHHSKSHALLGLVVLHDGGQVDRHCIRATTWQDDASSLQIPPALLSCVSARDHRHFELIMFATARSTSDWVSSQPKRKLIIPPQLIFSLVHWHLHPKVNCQ
ncbi:hypothetical protein AUEXF2481DRAFT_355002 [Aureobasidium subglaciale EXF-2481]|uniref:Secreted protein n=1 Tax=Aureobasidium subglaciale (strain EXF-2481) TaxID=1043005 RepID=A0A074Y5W0_AURSE|nr:uncharacterized protein AUEXF2481DRAFT_355002 [Aureobasidium subglaciale EXF-2481]KEQ93138.1 hypothetical protein AUEXF2481DRAFT_355002 [Aureobasidium subglaciale EXF-2481]